MIKDWTSEPVRLTQLNAVLVIVTLVMVSLYSSKILSRAHPVSKQPINQTNKQTKTQQHSLNHSEERIPHNFPFMNYFTALAQRWSWNVYIFEKLLMSNDVELGHTGEKKKGCLAKANMWKKVFLSQKQVNRCFEIANMWRVCEEGVQMWPHRQWETSTEPWIGLFHFSILH